MTIIDKYLNIIYEQYMPSVAKAKIHGEFQNEWTTCYNSKCQEETENKYTRKYCKTVCQIKSLNNAINRLNIEIKNCVGTRDPNKCVNSLRNTISSYKDKITNAREMQDKISSKELQFRRQSIGV